jgi:hypothetical protein
VEVALLAEGGGALPKDQQLYDLTIVRAVWWGEAIA